MGKAVSGLRVNEARIEKRTVTVKDIVRQVLALYPSYENEPECMAWVSQYDDANMAKTDFFEAHSTTYAKSTALVDNLYGNT